MRERLSEAEVATLMAALTPAPTRELSERQQTAVRRYLAGDTLDTIASDAGVTRERIRQIIGSTPWPVPTLTAARKAAIAERDADLKARLEAWSFENPGVPLEVAAEQFHTTIEHAAHLIGRRSRAHRETVVKKSSHRSDEEILADIRRCHEETGRVTASSFANWARENGVPGNQTAQIRFGGWAAAVEAAGIKGTARVKRQRTFTDDDLWAALVDLLRIDPTVSAQGAPQILKSIPGAPSFAQIRHRLDLPWSTLRNEALAALAGTSTREPGWVETVLQPRDWSRGRKEIDPVQPVREAIAVLGPDLSSSAYSTWARDHGKPAAPTLTRHFGGSWIDLLRAAGGEPSVRAIAKSGPRARIDVAADVRRFLAEHPGGSSTAYERWARANAAATLGTVLLRHGTWASARAAAGE